MSLKCWLHLCSTALRPYFWGMSLLPLNIYKSMNINFKSNHRFLKCWAGLWLGHFGTWRCFDMNYSFVTLAACLRTSCYTEPQTIIKVWSPWQIVLLNFTTRIISSPSRKTTPQHDTATPMSHGVNYVFTRVLDVYPTWNVTNYTQAFL